VRSVAAILACVLLAPVSLLLGQSSVVVSPEVRVNVPFRVTATQADRSGVLGYRLIVDDVQVGPDVLPSAVVRGAITVTATVTTPGWKLIRLVAFDAQGELSSPAIAVQVLRASCDYQSPAGGPITQRPPRTRILGMNTITTQAERDTQAARVQQLEAWGWQVTSDTVDASRMLVVATCP
jgi:hypothetical protein